MDWFERLTGFTEPDYYTTQAQLETQGETLVCKPQTRIYQMGRLLTPTLAELRRQTATLSHVPSSIKVREWVGDVQQLHQDPANRDAVFQVASQFNLLEMVSPHVTPLHGITDYAFDKTQGPVCAMACGAGTLYRNYLVPLENQIGQTDSLQLNMLDQLEKALNNDIHQYWTMQNGYLMPSS